MLGVAMQMGAGLFGRLRIFSKIAG